MIKNLFHLSGFYQDKKAEVERALVDGGGKPFAHAKYPGAICFLSAKAYKELQLSFAKHGAKLTGPILFDEDEE